MVVRNHPERTFAQLRAKLGDGPDDGEASFLRRRAITLRLGQRPASIGNCPLCSLQYLEQLRAKPRVTCARVNFCLCMLVEIAKDGRCLMSSFKLVECSLVFFCSLKPDGVFFKVCRLHKTFLEISIETPVVGTKA